MTNNQKSDVSAAGPGANESTARPVAMRRATFNHKHRKGGIDTMNGEQIHDIPIDRIDANPQVRKQFDENVIAAMALTIASMGVLSPIRVRKAGDRFIIVDGGQRYRAAKLAGLKSIPCLIDTAKPEAADILAKQLISNCARSDLNPIEKAHGIRDYMRTSGLNAVQTAERLGFSNADISRHVKLLSLPPDIQEKIASGVIPASAGHALAGLDNPAQQAALAAQVAGGSLTRDDLAGAIKASKWPNGKPPSELKRASAVLANGGSVTVVAPGLDFEVFIDSLTSVAASARKHRGRGVELATFLQMLKDQIQ